MKNLNRLSEDKKTRIKNRKRLSLSDFTAYYFLLPSFLILMLCHVVPIFMNMFYSFTDYSIMQPPTFTGLSNYKQLATDPFIFASIRNTIVYTIIVVPIQTILSLIFATLIAQYCRNKWGEFIKGSLFIPVIASMILIGTVWRMFLATDGGFINNILNLLGFDSINWLGQKNTSLISVCLVSIWKNVGYFLVIFYAGIMDIPKSLFEASEIDGASKVQQFFGVTLPSLKAITYLVVTLGTIWSFQVFGLVHTMTGGGPGTSTMTLVLSIYNTGFRQYNLGYASVISVLLLIFVLLISAILKVLFNPKEDKVVK